MATGNYCFFNLLAILLCLSFVDDGFWPSDWRRGILGKKREAEPGRGWAKAFMAVWALIVILITSSQMAGLFRSKLPWSSLSFQAEKMISGFRSVNSYGLFAVMTTTRSEIMLEGSNDGETWLRYRFEYKPGPPRQIPGFVQPHQPRLDWQMWFAALGNYKQNAWFLNFCSRLMEGSPAVLKLLHGNPFPAAPPKYIRAVLYEYSFTDAKEKAATRRWWHRVRLGLYCPVMSLQNINTEKNA